MIWKKWDKQKVIKAIRERHKQGKALSKTSKENSGLYAAAVRLFGGWNKALRAAGFNAKDRKKWNRERVIQQIQERHSRGLPLTRIKEREPSLASAAGRYFGCWTDAVIAAGIQPDTPRSWSKERVIQAIQQRRRQGLPMSYMSKHDTGLGYAALKYCGSWSQALIYAGFPEYVQHKEKWSKERVIMEIHKRKELGLPMRHIARDNGKLAKAAVRWFGSWDNAVEAAGLKPGPRLKWNKEKVIEAIQAYHANGYPLSKVWRQDRSLYTAATKYFGCWSKAQRAVGIPKPYRKQRQWDPEGVIAEIQRRHREGLPLIGVQKLDNALASAAIRYYDTWHDAVRAAGLEPSVRQTWSRERVIEEIQLRHRQGLPLRNVREDDSPLCAAGHVYFGSWDNAMRAAGFERREPVWTRKRVVKELKAWHAQGRPLNRIWKEHICLAAAIRRHFECTQEAMDAAGFDWKPLQKWSTERVITELQVWDRAKLPKSEINTWFPGLQNAVQRYFGRWDIALEAAGLQPRRARKWSKEKVVNEIQMLHVQGKSLKTTTKDNRALVGAAARYFGNWSNALEAAGVLSDVEKPKQKSKWSRPLVLKAIHSRHEQGLPMVDVMRDDAALARAATRFFGSWRDALEAAGLSRAKTTWNKQRVIAEIQSCFRQGMTMEDVWQKDWNFARIAKEHFGAWHNAVMAAGINEEEIITKSPWSRERVLDEIVQRHIEGLPLISSWPSNRILASAAKRHCGSWTNALQLAEIDQDSIGR